MFRFPSTNIRLAFQSLVDEADPPVTVRQLSPSKPRAPLPPLRINIPDQDANFSSPFPSPTGTIRYAILFQKVIFCNSIKSSVNFVLTNVF